MMILQNNQNNEQQARPERLRSPYQVMVAIRDEDDMCALLNLACAMAQNREGEVYVITVTPEGVQPTWFKTPEQYEDIPIHKIIRSGKNVGAVILEESQNRDPDVLILGWRGKLNRGRYFLGKTLDPVIQSAPCDVIVMRGECPLDAQRILLPAAGGPNAPRALAFAHALAPEAEITALYVALEHLGPSEVLLGRERLDQLRRGLPDNINVRTRVIQAKDPIEGILEEAKNDTDSYDLLIIGAGNENVLGRFLFGDTPQIILSGSPIPTMVVRRRLTNLHSLVRRIWVRIFGLVPTLTVQEQAEVYRTVRRGSRPSTDFFVMITLASAIASIGLLADSPAVIIGAMLVAPLMTAILGMGLSLVVGDMRFFLSAFGTTIRGVILAIITGSLVGFIVPGAATTQEMLSRGNPTVLDLGVALVSGAAAAYALSRKDVSAALAGVAIAAALAPPLTTIGISLRLTEWWTAGGALLLFSTNMISIVAAGGLTFFLLGFRPELGDPGRSVILRRGIWGVSVLLAATTLLLAVLTSQSLQELWLNQAIEITLQEELTTLVSGAELIDWEIAHAPPDLPSPSADTLHLDITIRSPETMSHADAHTLQERVAQRLSRPVALSLGMVPATRLQAYVPLTPNPTSTVLPTEVPPITATSTLNDIPTRTPNLISDPQTLLVYGVGSTGVNVHYSPAGLLVGTLPLSTTVTVLEGPIEIEGRGWYHVDAPTTGLEGWVAQEYLTPTLKSNALP
jgi:uncharacterized hydrophobic protein (TIGR00271 family)